MKPTIWNNCYDFSWKGLITDASFSHPAKFARGLIERIYDHCLAKGYLKRGDLVGDPFGGIGTGGITAAYRGLNWVGCELEPKFVAFAQENFRLHRHGWQAVRGGTATIIQGDSRLFDEHVAGMDDYGRTVGQIGSLKSGAVEAVISSPPFTQGYQGGGGINKNGYTGKHLTGKHRCGNPDEVGKRTYQGQGGDRTAGNIETLKEGTVQGVVSSPPYAAADNFKREANARREAKLPAADRTGASQHGSGYGTAAGQISQLKGGSVDGVVSSPPCAVAKRIQTTNAGTFEPSKSYLCPDCGKVGVSTGKGRPLFCTNPECDRGLHDFAHTLPY